VVVVGCHGGGSGDVDGPVGEPGQPDAAGDAPIDASIDAPIDAPPHQSVTAVATDDGFTEVRQGMVIDSVAGQAHIVITGTLLGDVDTVSVGPLPATITSVTATEVRADLEVPHGFAPGPQIVTVSSPTFGTSEAPNPVTTTYFTIGPNAAPGGHGTHQSPMTLCDVAAIDNPAYITFSGDTVDLLSGTHTSWCGPVFLPYGVDVRGAGTVLTVLGAGFPGFELGSTLLYGNPTTTSHIGGFTAVEPAGTVVAVDTFIAEQTPGLVVDALAITGSTTTGVAVTGNASPKSAMISNLSYTGTGDAIHLESTIGSVTQSAIHCGGTGIELVYQGALDVGDATIEDCAIGLGLSAGVLSSPFDPNRPTMTVHATQIHATTGAKQDRGTLTMTNVDIVATGPNGISQSDGRIQMTNGSVHADDTALSVFTTSTGGFDHASVVEATGVDFIGGRVGIEYANSGDPGHLAIDHCRAQGGDFGLVWDNGDPQTSISIGNNDLVGGVFAYHDAFDHFGTVNAVGTTLNGRSYAGSLIVGPAELAPDYKVDFAGAGTQF
jgi:hypothetical protein